MPKNVLRNEAVVACQTMAATAYFMSTVNGHINDKNQKDTIWWQERSAHWSSIARRLMSSEITETTEE